MPVKTLPAASLPDDVCPPRLKQIHFRELDVGKVSEDYYVKGWICERFPLITGTTKLLKMILEEDGAGPSTAGEKVMNVFIFGGLALESDKALNKGDMVALSGFLVDKSPSASKDGRHHLQLELCDEDGSCIWTSSPNTSSTRPSNNADISSPPVKRRPNSTNANYTYVTIDKIREGMQVNLYAAVKFFRPPTSTHGRDHSMILALVDQSDSNHGLRCVLFGHPDQLPKVKCVGDIIRVHRLKIQRYKDSLQGSNGPGFTALVFSGQIGASLNPSSTTKNYHLDPAVDHKLLVALRQWASEHFVSPSIGICFSDIKPPQFLDIRCQLVAKAVVDHRTTILKVWDGTHCPYPVHCFPVDDSAVLVSKSDLLRRSQRLIVDIAAYDDHAKSTRNLQLGSFLKIFNLHAILRQSRDPDAPQGELEIVLHGGGTAFGRAVSTLPSDSPELTSLCRALEKVTEETEDDLVIETLPAAADSRSKTTDEYQNEALEDLTCTQEFNFNATEPRCLQSSATVLTAHHHIKTVSLRTVLGAAVPNKHRIRARLIGYSPESIYRGIRLHCPRCNALRDIPSQEAISSVLKSLATWPIDPEIQRSKEHEPSSWSHCYTEDAATLEDNWNCRERPIFRLVPCNGKLGSKQSSALLVEGTAVMELECLSDDVGCVIPVTSQEGSLNLPDDPVPFVIKKRQSYYRCLVCSQLRGGSIRGLEQLNSFDVNKIAEALGIQPMRYIFTLRFVLRDSTGEMVRASLAADEAELFFRGLKAEAVLADEGLQDYLVGIMHKLCPHNDNAEHHPWLECCLKSFYSGNPGAKPRVHYRIFSSTLATNQ